MSGVVNIACIGVIHGILGFRQTPIRGFINAERRRAFRIGRAGRCACVIPIFHVGKIIVRVLHLRGVGPGFDRWRVKGFRFRVVACIGVGGKGVVVEKLSLVVERIAGFGDIARDVIFRLGFGIARQISQVVPPCRSPIAPIKKVWTIAGGIVLVDRRRVREREEIVVGVRRLRLQHAGRACPFIQALRRR